MSVLKNDGIFRLESGSPNLSFSKFYQNLQMLNCCIQHRLRHEKETNNTGDDNVVEQDDDGEEFFECQSNISPSKSNLTELPPEGRLKPCGDLKLLHADEILYIPETQVSFEREISMTFRMHRSRNVHR